MTRTVVRSLWILATTVVVAGCGSDSPSSPSSPQSIDVGAIISQMAAGGLSAFPSTTGLPVPSTTTPTIVPSTCPYSSATQGFVCSPIVAGGLTFNESFWLYDALGHSQSQADAATTASVRSVTDTKGTTALPAASGEAGSTTLTGHNDMTMSGLLTGHRILNGTSTAHDDITVTAPTASHLVGDVTTTTTNVALPPQGSSTTWPLSGTIAVDLTSTESGGALTLPALTIHSVMTFNGTSIATITTTLAGATSTCLVDLSGKTAPVCTL